MYIYLFIISLRGRGVGRRGGPGALHPGRGTAAAGTRRAPEGQEGGREGAEAPRTYSKPTQNLLKTYSKPTENLLETYYNPTKNLLKAY